GAASGRTSQGKPGQQQAQAAVTCSNATRRTREVTFRRAVPMGTALLKVRLTRSLSSEGTSDQEFAGWPADRRCDLLPSCAGARRPRMGSLIEELKRREAAAGPRRTSCAAGWRSIFK